MKHAKLVNEPILVLNDRQVTSVAPFRCCFTHGQSPGERVKCLSKESNNVGGNGKWRDRSVTETRNGSGNASRLRLW